MINEHVCAIVVTFKPAHPALRDLIGAAVGQVGAIVVVDNDSTSDSTVMIEQVDGVDAFLPQSQNIGLAAAQNLGICWARARGFTYVLLLDQDSIPGKGMVDALFSSFNHAGPGWHLAAVGPCFRDLREHQDAPFIRLGFPWSKKLYCGAESKLLECDFLISSGALIPMRVLDAIGDMRSGLFIDNIDLEWGFRAKAAGYVLAGVCSATMHHHLGDSRRKLPFGLGNIVVHGSARLYYIMRNRLLLYRMPHTPRVWIAQDLPRVVMKFLIFSVLVGPRAKNLRFMWRGLRDGIRGREGACPL